MNNFKFLKTAYEDLFNVIDYIANSLKNPKAAKAINEAIFETIDNICLFPKSASLAKSPNLYKLGIRQQIVKNFCIFYSFDSEKEEITIIYIKYAKKDLNTIKKP